MPTKGYKARFLEWLKHCPNGAEWRDILMQYPAALPELQKMRDKGLVFEWEGRWYWSTPKEQLA